MIKGKRSKDTMHDLSSMFEENRARLFSYLMRMCGTYELAWDIMQETYTRYLERYRERENSPALLYKIAYHAFVDHTRRQAREVVFEEEHAVHEIDLEHTLMVREGYQSVLRALGQLGQDDRNLISLVIGGDVSYRQIADMMGMSEANVKVRVHRIRIRLREILKGEKP
ncbi:MAG TPA: RNA polymerase sigma factor [Deltaproteobacteria bacterium]|nr:RNA polymerase sigma factor [Deltaproteobacteria bacterium]